MGLRAEIQADIAAAFDDDLADTVSDLVLQTQGDTYNHITGAVIRNATQTTTRGVVSPVSESMIDGEHIKVSDVQIIILKNELDAEVKVEDIILEGTNKFNINNIISDPANAIWVLIARQIV